MTITLSDNRKRDPGLHPMTLKVLLTIILFACTLWVFFPGSYSGDSWDQYKEMTTGHYRDWYDGGLAATWHVLWKITGSLESLYVLYMILYWSLFLFMVWRISLRSVNFWVLLLLAVFFCFIPQFIMRDTLLALSWAWAAALLWRVSGSGSRRWAVIVALLLLILGLWARLNTLVALFPLLWAAIGSIVRRPFPLGKRLLINIFVWAGMILVVLGLTYKVLQAKKAYPGYKLKLLDVAGISVMSGTDLFPSCIRAYPYYNYDTIRVNYVSAGFDNIYWPPGHRQSVIPSPPDAALYSCLSHSWAVAVRQHPFLYLENRLSGYLYYLHIRHRDQADGYDNTYIGIEPDNPAGLSFHPNKAQLFFMSLYAGLDGTFVFSPWFWLLSNGFAFAFFFRNARRTGARYWWVQTYVQLSGLLYILSQFPVFQSDMEFRLCYWNVFVALFAISAVSLGARRRDSV